MKTSLEQHLREQEVDHDLRHLIRTIAHNAKYVHHAMQTGDLGLAGTSNMYGEKQLALDVLSNEIFVKSLTECCFVSALASEELDDVVGEGDQGTHMIHHGVLGLVDDIPFQVNTGAFTGSLVVESDDGSFGIFAAFRNMQALAMDEDPTRACRPFDRNRSGVVVSEGGCLYVLERKSRAEARGARIYAEIAGYAINTDATDFVLPNPERQAECMNLAIKRAGIDASLVAIPNFFPEVLRSLSPELRDDILRFPPCASGSDATCGPDGQCLTARGEPDDFFALPIVAVQSASGAAFLDVGDLPYISDHFRQALVDLSTLLHAVRTADWSAAVGQRVRAETSA